MSKVKKAAKRDRSVMYVRVTPQDREQIEQIVQKRGYPHTMASVAAEMLSRGLASEAAPEVKAAS
jgi:hypothetical protein